MRFHIAKAAEAFQEKNSMKDRFFLDTNIFIYTFDDKSSFKKKIATQLVADALGSGAGIISYQVIQEFLNVCRKKFEKPMDVRDQFRYLDLVLSPMCEVYPSIEFYRRGIELSQRYGFSFYDSLILAAAIVSGCNTLYSEDMQHFQQIENVTIKNPFSEN